jgi:hypothetical protein
MTETKHAIDMAKDIVYGDREKTYGSPDVNLNRIAEQWELYLRQKYHALCPLTPEDVCWMMTQLKMSRQMHKPKQDNLVDAIGYLALIERCGEKK